MPDNETTEAEGAVNLKEIMDIFEEEREWRGCPSGLCQRYGPEDCKCANTAARRARERANVQA